MFPCLGGMGGHVPHVQNIARTLPRRHSEWDEAATTLTSPPTNQAHALESVERGGASWKFVPTSAQFHFAVPFYCQRAAALYFQRCEPLSFTLWMMFSFSLISFTGTSGIYSCPNVLKLHKCDRLMWCVVHWFLMDRILRFPCSALAQLQMQCLFTTSC